MVVSIHKGFLIEPIYERGQWRILVRKANGSSVCITFPGGERREGAWHWLSSPYMDKEFGLAQIRHAIDRGQLA